jgi:hypothetical protein
MSWQDRIEKKLSITTGDGKVWEVLWKNAQKAVEWNGTEFQFIGVEGTLARKKKLLGRKFPLEFYFQGADHLEEAKLFEISANDPRAWIVEHPYYDTIIAQVFSLNIDDSGLNVSKITCTAIETMTEDGTRLQDNPVDTIELQKITLDEACEAELTTEPTIQDVNTLQSNVESNYDEGVKIVSIPEEAEEYFNAFNEASSLINTVTASPLLAMRAMVSLLSLPAQFTADVKARIDTLRNQWDILRRTLNGLTRRPSKQLYEIQGTTILSAMCRAATTPLSGNYTNSTSALNIAEIIQEVYEEFLEDLDEIQSSNASDPLNFIPGFDVMSQLSDIVNLSISALLQIALNGKVERSVILKEDSNVVLLTHRFYGLDLEDANITELIENNNFNYQQIALGIKKGTRVVYYK